MALLPAYLVLLMEGVRRLLIRGEGDAIRLLLPLMDTLSPYILFYEKIRENFIHHIYLWSVAGALLIAGGILFAQRAIEFYNNKIKARRRGYKIENPDYSFKPLGFPLEAMLDEVSKEAKPEKAQL